MESSETPPRDSVAGVLFALARQIWAGGELQLSEPDFTGEGVAVWIPSVGLGLAVGLGADWARAISQSEGRIILQTSGSSGVPKRVQHRIAALGRSVVVSPRHQAAVWALAFNPTHIAGVQVVLQAWANGNPVVNLWGVSPAEAVSRCRQWGVTHVSASISR